jgi:hypothetical protein
MVQLDEKGRAIEVKQGTSSKNGSREMMSKDMYLKLRSRQYQTFEASNVPKSTA